MSAELPQCDKLGALGRAHGMTRSGVDKNLLDQIAAGDMAAAEKLFELAAAGDEEAKAAVLRLISDKAHGQGEALAESRKDSFQGSLKSAVKSLQATGPVHESVVEDLVREARSLGSCETAQALGFKAYFLQLRDRIVEADNVLAIAWETAGRCPACRAELHWRRAELRGAQGRCTEGLGDADAAVRSYRKLGTPGHDIDGEGEAKSLLIRGMLRNELGELCGSIADYCRVLKILSPRRTPDLYAYAVVNLAFPLRKTGPEGREQAVRLIAGARKKFHGVLKGDLPRALLDWLEGGLKLSLGHRYRYRWKNLLRRAMKDFARMGMGAHAMAVMADLARVELRDREAIRDLFTVPEIGLLVLDSRFREPLRGLLDAAKERTTRAFERLDESIHRLRCVAEETPGVLPCFVS